MNIKPLLAAYTLDLAIGDPHALPHPVRLIGKLITAGEPLVRRIVRPADDSDAQRREVIGGALLSVCVVAASYLGARYLLNATKKFDKRFGTMIEVVLAWTTLATGSLLAEAGAVLDALAAEDIEAARVKLSRIVGRDTEHLNESEVARAVIETVAESTGDGIIAPLVFLATGGVPLAFAYKAVNTLDSMIGHIEPPYTHFGRVAARTDDAANFIPARLTASLIVCVAPLLGHDARAAWRVLRRDAHLHRSPNAGQPEAAMAGALRVRLGGTNTYDGIAHAGAIFGREHEVATPRQARASLRVALAASLVGCGMASLWLRWRS